MARYQRQSEYLGDHDENAMSDGRYWEAKRCEDAEDAAYAAERRAYAQTPAGRLEQLAKRAEHLDWQAVEVGGVTDEERQEAWTAYRTLKAEIDAEEQARFAAEWTREQTIERRAAWNAWALSHKSKIRGIEVADHQRSVGFTFEALKRAVSLHSL